MDKQISYITLIGYTQSYITCTHKHICILTYSHSVYSSILGKRPWALKHN